MNNSSESIPGDAIEVNTLLSHLHSIYNDLVWIARRPTLENKRYWEKSNIETCNKELKNMLRIQDEYPDQCERLLNVESGDYEYGFSCGMLAAIRYLEAIETDGIEAAENDFPDLDT